MGKTKSAAPDKAMKPSKGKEVKQSAVKDSAVTKPSQTPKAKSKEMAKQVASKANDKTIKKAAKEPTPDSSDDDEDASASSEEDQVSGESPASSDESEEDSSDDEVSAAKDAHKTNGVKTNGVTKAAKKADGESSDSSASSDDEASKPSAPQAVAGAAATSGSDDDSEEDSEDDSEEEPEVKAAVDANAVKDKLASLTSKNDGSDAESNSDDSESGSGSLGSSEEEDSSEESEEETVAPKKRKAEEHSTPVAKKSKTDGVADSGKKNLFVGHLSWNVDEEWLTREFEKFGELASVRVITERDSGRSKGFGYVEFVNAEDAIKAQGAMHEADIDGRNINVDFAVPKDKATPRQDRSKQYGDSQPSEASATLFVANLAFDADNDTVGEEFGKHGNVIGVRLPTDKDTGEPKGFGYVEFGSVEEAQKVFGAMSGATIMGRPIRLDYSTPRPPRENNGFGGDRGRGRGGSRGRGGFDRGGRGGGRGRGGFDRGGRGGGRGGRGGSTNRGGFGDFQGKKVSF